jgi:exoribonuclease R
MTELHNLWIANVQDRLYTDYSFLNPVTGEIRKTIGTEKMFHEDVFCQISENEFILESSPVKSAKYIPGILNTSRTYGRTDNKKRLIYACTPYNKHLPIFLVAFNLKIGFEKDQKNKYVIFKYENWDDKHPSGILTETLGDVNHLPAFYEYKLYCKQVHFTNSEFAKTLKQKYGQKTHEEWVQTILDSPNKYGFIEDRRKIDNRIFSIDPTGCIDRDDALSITQNSNNTYRISVYIANVWVWLQLFDLWHLLKDRVSTIYLPDRQRAMLPHTLCSLDIKKTCISIVMDFIVSHDGDIINKTVTQACINIHKNYDYDSPSLLENKYYGLLFDITRKCKNGASVNDSHELVAYWMMEMNHSIANMMYSKKIGIYRNCVMSSSTTKNVSEKESRTQQISSNPFIRIWESSLSGKYVLYGENASTEHKLLDLSIYTHFTSPIRRSIDLLNQCLWVIDTNPSIETDPNRSDYIREYQNNIEKVNTSMKSIRKIQTECELLYRFYNYPELFSGELDAIVLEVQENKKCLVYLEKIQWISQIKTDVVELSIYQKIKCKLWLFTREDDTHKKIKCELVSL